jgi:hypothetical protein
MDKKCEVDPGKAVVCTEVGVDLLEVVANSTNRHQDAPNRSTAEQSDVHGKTKTGDIDLLAVVAERIRLYRDSSNGETTEVIKEEHAEDSTVNAFRDNAPKPMELSRLTRHSVGIQYWQSSPGAYPVLGPQSSMNGCSSDNNSTVSECEVGEAGESSTLDAVLVQEDMMEPGVATPGMELIIPDKISDSKNPWRGRKLVCMLVGLAMVAAGILLPIVLVSMASTSGGVQSNQSISEELTPELNASLHHHFQDALSKSILQDIQDPLSPFSAANRWMLDDPYLNSYSLWRQHQRFYLAMLYHATHGDHWFHKDHWMSYNTSECQWYSHSSLPEDSDYYIPNVCDKNGSIVSLSLSNNNLTGGVPLFPTAMLPYLKAFDVADNVIGGRVPPLVANPNLETLILSYNDFEGSWRVADGNLEFENLKVKNFNGNRMSVGIPNNLGHALYKLQHSVEVWNASDNLFAGTLATEIGLATNLIYFGRQDNLGTGTLPSELGLLRHIQRLDLGGNIGVNGTIPAELGGLTVLTHLDLAGTALSGAIPADLCVRVSEGTLEIEVNCSVLDCCF